MFSFSFLFLDIVQLSTTQSFTYTDVSLKMITAVIGSIALSYGEWFKRSCQADARVHMRLRTLNVLLLFLFNDGLLQAQVMYRFTSQSLLSPCVLVSLTISLVVG